MLRANSLRDPDAALGGTSVSPFGFATMAGLYDVYRVYKGAIQVYAQPGPGWNGGLDAEEIFEGQALFMEFGRNWTTAGTARNQYITDSITDRLTGVTAGMTTMPATGEVGFQSGFGFPAAVAALQCNGATFQGCCKWRRFEVPTLRDGGNRRMKYRNRIAQSYDMWRFAGEAQSFKDWIADKEYESVMTNDPVKGFFIGFGLVNMVGFLNVIPVTFTYKMKLTSILSRPKRPSLALTPAAFDPPVAVDQTEVMQRTLA